jgi:GT2 family glycosyltransferase
VHLVAHNYDPAALGELQREHPSLVLHQVSGIRGYSQNNNVALRAARGRYLVILNDDTMLRDDLFGRLVAFLDRRPDVVAVCPVLRNPDGSVQMGLRGRLTPLAFLAQQLKVDRLLPPRWAARLGAFDRAPLPPENGGPVDLEAGTGACFMVRREALEAIGFLDEAFFLAPDDIDWTMRLRRRAGRVMLLPDASVIHLGGSTLARTYDAVLPSVYAGYYTFFRRYYGPAAEWFIRLTLGLGWSAVLTLGWALVWGGGRGGLSRSPRARTMMRARRGCVRFALSRRSSPEVFAELVGKR